MINHRKAVLTKLAETVISDRNAPFHQQRARLTQFSHDLHMKYKIVLTEMEGDLKILKEQNFNKDMWKIFAKLWLDLVAIFQKYDEEKPYDTAETLIKFVHNKHTANIISNLEFLIKNHLANVEPFVAGPMLQPVKIKSLSLLTEWADKLAQYVLKNPLLPIPGSEPIKEPLELNTIKEEFTPIKIHNDEVTFVPPAKK